MFQIHNREHLKIVTSETPADVCFIVFYSIEFSSYYFCVPLRVSYFAKHQRYEKSEIIP